MPTRTERRIDPPIKDMARPRRSVETVEVRTAWRESITPITPLPIANWAMANSATMVVVPSRQLPAAITANAPAATRAEPHRSVNTPTRRAPSAAPIPPAPMTTLIDP